MTGAWGVIVIVVVAGAVLVRITIIDMARRETETRLNRLPHALLRLAVGQLPADQREERAAELESELAFVLQDTDGLPVTRLVRGIWFALSLLASARTLGRELPARPAPEHAATHDSPRPITLWLFAVIESEQRTRNLIYVLLCGGDHGRRGTSGAGTRRPEYGTV